MRKNYFFVFPLVAAITLFGIVGFFVFGVPAPKMVEAATQGQTVSLSVTSTITFSVGSPTVSLGTLTPGAAITATTSASVSTNAANGWTLSIKRDDASSTLDMTTDATTDFPDYTAWNYSSPNSNTTPGANLSFRVMSVGTDVALYNSTWWGSDDTTNAKYAGFPTTSQTIATIGSYVSSNQTVVYKFRADAPATQKTGSYDGAVTLTALAIP